MDMEKGDAWRKRRRVLTPAFSAHKLKLVSTSHHRTKHGGCWHVQSAYLEWCDICTFHTCTSYSVTVWHLYSTLTYLYPGVWANYGWIKWKVCWQLWCTTGHWYTHTSYYRCQLMSIGTVNGWNWSTLDETVHTNSQQWMVARIQISYILSRCATAEIQCWWPCASRSVNQHCISAVAHLDRI